MNTPTTSSKTTTSVVINSLTSATVTFADGSTMTFGPNPILDLVANKTVPLAMLHAALFSFHVSAVATAKQSGSDAATAAFEPVHTQIEALLVKGTPDDLTAARALVAQAMLPSKQKRIAKAQKAADDAVGVLKALQAET